MIFTNIHICILSLLYNDQLEESLAMAQRHYCYKMVLFIDPDALLIILLRIFAMDQSVKKTLYICIQISVKMTLIDIIQHTANVACLIGSR